LDRLEDLKPNVQSKVYQLVAERDPDPRRRLEITERGSRVAPDDAREGLAKGVKGHFYDGLEGVTLDWYGQETNPIIRGHLAEHFSRFADVCAPYERMVMRINEEEPRLRDRLLVGAEGRPLYVKLKAVETRDLFSGIDNPSDLARAIRDSLGARPRRKILMLAANPVDRRRLRLEVEHREIQNRVRMLRSTPVDLEFVIEPAARTQDLLTAVLGSDAEVFHFSGHGEVNGLVFETDDGLQKRVDGAPLAQHLKTIGRSLKCALLPRVSR
jgi:hypothetical protein